MSGPTLQIFFDYNSPYSYIASTQIEALCRRCETQLQWVPFVLGGVFKERGVTPPFRLPYRVAYLNQDLEDLAAFYGIPYRHRTEFLFNPILSLRATLAVPSGESRSRAVHALFRGAFVEDQDLGQPNVVRSLLDQAGLDGPALVEAAGSPPVKEELKRNTDLALSKGLFGAPSFLLEDGKMFWGQDRMTVLEWYLKNRKGNAGG
ncbi:MAG: 2-hydroxychromene-2-carboxylate isomerase, partial [Deltaproteobacteria bacterium]|nr:2-hydroxychromene-2-carboxylate isomerase [Deltaproteobacteria bacterium]